jgi:uncharacterized protein (DUF169 family)
MQEEKMANKELQTSAEFLSSDLRLKTFPVSAKFLKTGSGFPEKTRQPSAVLRKKITICQAVTLARVYGWTVGLRREDLICVPSMIAFGFAKTTEPEAALGRLFCEMDFARNKEAATQEAESMFHFENEEYEAILLSPLQKGLYDPETIAVYGNPAQVTRMVQSLVYQLGKRIPGNFGGKVECSEYLIAPFKTSEPRITIPGNGDRIFSMTQDDEMVLSLPGRLLNDLIQGLKESGKSVGARYPVTFYQNFQPEFPKAHIELGTELGIL